MIRKVEVNDAEAICNIYNYYIENTTVTFEEQPLSVSAMRERISSIIALYPYIVYELDGRVVGYAYATNWKTRTAYRYSVESTVYVDLNIKGQGIGTKLYSELLKQLKDMGVHSVLGGISIPNEPSVALHEKLGFKKVAHIKEVGYRFDQWLDVGYWQYLFDK